MNTNPSAPDFKSGYVAVAGRPNVGKSTLMNALVGEKIAIASARPQTTRRRQLGILTDEAAQIIFVDIPGINRPRHVLDKYMRATVNAALEDADVILWVVDVSASPGPGDRHIGKLFAQQDKRIVLALNKSDRLTPGKVIPHTNAYQILAPSATWMLTSATRGDNLNKLLQLLTEALPYGPQYYPADQLTETQLRDLAADFVREAALQRLREEVPHGVEVQIEDFDESAQGLTRISATIHVERESHKGIVIGKGGAMLKDIGMHARKEIESLLGEKVFLDLHVKVMTDWRSSERDVRRFGYRAD